MIKSPLPWYGGKHYHIDFILQNEPALTRTFVDVFGGSGVVAVNAKAPVRVYNDLNSEIVTLYRVMRERGDELKAALIMTPYAREEYGVACQGIEEAGIGEVERARRIFIKHRMGFGGGGRDNGHWAYNITGGSGDSGKRVSAFVNSVDGMDSFLQEMRRIQVEHEDFGGVISRYDKPHTLFYCDPPYLLATRNSGNVYTHEFNVADHERLADSLHGVEGMAIVSGYPSPLYDELFAGWHQLTKETRKWANIQGQREKATECLWLNPRLTRVLQNEARVMNQMSIF